MLYKSDQLFTCKCRLLITFANSLDPDQAQHIAGLNLDPNCLTLWWYSRKNFSKRLILKKTADDKKVSRQWVNPYYAQAGYIQGFTPSWMFGGPWDSTLIMMGVPSLKIGVLSFYISVEFLKVRHPSVKGFEQALGLALKHVWQNIKPFLYLNHLYRP